MSDDKMELWVSDWASEFSDQYSSENVKSWVGKTVTLKSPDPEPSEFSFDVVGYAEIRIFTEGGEEAVQVSIVDSEGRMTPIKNGYTVEVPG